MTEQGLRESETAKQPVLRAMGIVKSFGGIRALKGVSLTLMAGEVHALVGENGAGKSTLIKVLTGAIQPDAGELWLRGERIEESSPARARALGIGVVYQEPALFPDLTVAENLSLEKQSTSLWRRVDRKAQRIRAARLLERVGARIRPETLAGALSMPEQQLVEIARTLDGHNSVLIMDEPTASLGEGDVENLFRIIGELRAEGTAVVYVSHRFEELFRISDRVTILRDGSSVETRLMAETTGKDLIDRMVGRPLDTVFPRHEAHTAGEIALDVRNVRCENLGVRNVSLTVRKGEVLGLAGLVGSGRTQFAEALFGLEPIDEGEVFVYGRKSTIKSPEDAVRSGLAYVPEDRRRHGVILGMSVATNTTLASLQQVSRHGFLSWRREEANAQTFVERLGVKTASTDAPARTLSGGNQQKVALARWLMTNPKILILDEPTQGIDVGAKAEIYKLIVDLARHGLAILMISSETPELLALCDRIAVMAKGKLAGILEREEATQHAVLDLALGHAKTSGGQTT